MRISKRYIESIINWGLSFDQISEGFKILGIEVEAVYTRDRVKGAVIARIESLEKATEKLSLATVSIAKDKTVKVITNSKTVKPGDIVNVCLPGGKVGDKDVVKATIQGFESEGVMLSINDFGLDPEIMPSNEREGVWILPGDSPFFTDPTDSLWLSDTILELKITPNHPEWLSVRGLLREIALTAWRLNGKIVDVPTLELNVEYKDGNCPIKLEIENPEDCPRYVGVYAEVSVRPSSFDMRKKLLAAGLRPVNNVVDATNLAMYEDGIPTHAFDADKIKSGIVRVARTKTQTTFETLDGQKRDLPVGTLMICDGDKPVGIAGIMGGAESEVSDSTTKIFLESAYFNPLLIAKTSMMLDLRSEASSRFEKGADWEWSQKTAGKVMNLAGLKPQKPVEAFAKIERRVVEVRTSRMKQILGFDLPQKKIKEGLEILGLKVTDGDPFKVEIPGNRHTDLKKEIDIIEEAVRAVGYDTIPTTFPVITERTMRETDLFVTERTVKRILSGIGLMECVSKMLTSPEELELLGMKDWIDKAPKILNPMTTDSTLMRPLAETGLVNICAYNIRQRNMDLGLFEVGSQYGPEVRKLTILLTGKRVTGWTGSAEYDFFDLKGIIESLLDEMLIGDVCYESSNISYLHPYRQAKLTVGSTELGYFGQLHPEISTKLDVPTPVFIASVDLDTLTKMRPANIEAKPTPVYPMVLRDIAILAPSSMSNAELEKAIKDSGGKYLTKVSLFDQYVGDFAKENKRSMAYSLTFYNDQGSLAGAQVDEAVTNIAKALESRGANLRSS
ncbi:MAG: phenylalanine--tRNA ligase subunit beta [Caldisericia bacterium]|nr:phenylalanine--tRNA ligase subunit beta [Caldisericia bacterium]